MVKETVTYTDFDGNEQTDTLRFHLSKIELVELEAQMPGGMSAFFEKVLKENDRKEIFKWFKEIVIMAYGVKSLDGKNFVKNDKIREDFKSSAAFSEFMMTLIQGGNDKMTAFINGIIPKID